MKRCLIVNQFVLFVDRRCYETKSKRRVCVRASETGGLRTRYSRLIRLMNSCKYEALSLIDRLLSEWCKDLIGGGAEDLEVCLDKDHSGGRRGR